MEEIWAIQPRKSGRDFQTFGKLRVKVLYINASSMLLFSDEMHRREDLQFPTLDLSLFFLLILSMGTTDSKLAFRKGVFRLFEERVSNNTSWL